MLEKLLNRTVAYKQFTYKPNGLLTVRLLPKQQEELNKKLKELLINRDVKFNAATADRDRAVRLVKADTKSRLDAIEKAYHNDLERARLEFEKLERELLVKYSTPLSDSEVALMTTKVGDFVPPVKQEATT